MKQLRLVNIFYPLPLLFYVLTGSPNLNGSRIGITLVISILLFLVVGYINYRKSSHKSQLMIDGLVILLVLTTVYFATQVNLSFALLTALWPILFFVPFSGRTRHAGQLILKACLFFALLYFGINQYAFENLLNARVAWMLVVFIPQFLFISTQFNWQNRFAMIRELGLSFVMAVLSLGLYSWLQFDARYALILVLIALPSLFTLVRLVSAEGKKVQIRQVLYFRILSIAGLTIFNCYLFLDVTQVLQAVMGGY